MLHTLGRRIAHRRWTWIKVGLAVSFAAAPVGVVLAVPWNSWLDVIGLGLAIVDTSGCIALAAYLYGLERALIDATLSEAQFWANLSARGHEGR